MIAPEILADIGPLLDALLGRGYRVVASEYSPEHFGNWFVDLAGPSAFRLCRDRSQFIVSAERRLLEPAGLWRAYDDVADFSQRVLAWTAG
jgi:hypothetical protein